jgi:hypothetical protein
MFIGLVGTACLIRLRLTLTSNAICYRDLRSNVQIPIDDVAAIRGVMIGREYSEAKLAKGPGLVLVVDTVPGRNSNRLSVSMKPFNKQQLCEMFSAAESRGIPVDVDEVVAALLAAK